MKPRLKQNSKSAEQINKQPVYNDIKISEYGKSSKWVERKYTLEEYKIISFNCENSDASCIKEILSNNVYDVVCFQNISKDNKEIIIKHLTNHKHIVKMYSYNYGETYLITIIFNHHFFNNCDIMKPDENNQFMCIYHTLKLPDGKYKRHLIINMVGTSSYDMKTKLIQINNYINGCGGITLQKCNNSTPLESCPIKESIDKNPDELLIILCASMNKQKTMTIENPNINQLITTLKEDDKKTFSGLSLNVYTVLLKYIKQYKDATTCCQFLHTKPTRKGIYDILCFMNYPKKNYLYKVKLDINPQISISKKFYHKPQIIYRTRNIDKEQLAQAIDKIPQNNSIIPVLKNALLIPSKDEINTDLLVDEKLTTEEYFRGILSNCYKTIHQHTDKLDDELKFFITSLIVSIGEDYYSTVTNYNEVIEYIQKFKIDLTSSQNTDCKTPVLQLLLAKLNYYISQLKIFIKMTDDEKKINNDKINSYKKNIEEFINENKSYFTILLEKCDDNMKVLYTNYIKMLEGLLVYISSKDELDILNLLLFMHNYLYTVNELLNNQKDEEKIYDLLYKSHKIGYKITCINKMDIQTGVEDRYDIFRNELGQLNLNLDLNHDNIQAHVLLFNTNNDNRYYGITLEYIQNNYCSYETFEFQSLNHTVIRGIVVYNPKYLFNPNISFNKEDQLILSFNSGTYIIDNILDLQSKNMSVKQYKFYDMYGGFMFSDNINFSEYKDVLKDDISKSIEMKNKYHKYKAKYLYLKNKLAQFINY